MRKCPKCKKENVTDDGYCAADCREITMPSLVKETPAVAGAAACSVMTTREHDLLVELKKLCKATHDSLNTNGVESIGVCYARRSAMRLMAQYEQSPNSVLDRTTIDPKECK